MPQLAHVITADELARRPAPGGTDLAPYFDILTSIQAEGGVGGLVTLSEGESQRTEKRRLSVAAKQQGYDLIWRKSAPGTLRFVLAKAGEWAPDARPRRPREEQAEEIPPRDALLTAEGAEVTDTSVGAANGVGGATPARRRGRRPVE